MKKSFNKSFKITVYPVFIWKTEVCIGLLIAFKIKLAIIPDGLCNSI